MCYMSHSLAAKRLSALLRKTLTYVMFLPETLKTAEMHYISGETDSQMKHDKQLPQEVRIFI